MCGAAAAFASSHASCFHPPSHGRLSLLYSSLLRVTKGDFDGFFGLFVDNLLQLLLIYYLCPVLCGMTHGEVTSKILPGAAVSILVGNFFYAMAGLAAGEARGA